MTLQPDRFLKPVRFFRYQIFNNYNYKDCIYNTFANLIFVSFIARSGFPETPILLGFVKSYLIPFTPNFDIGEGIDIRRDLLLRDLLSIKYRRYTIRLGMKVKIKSVETIFWKKSDS